MSRGWISKGAAALVAAVFVVASAVGAEATPMLRLSNDGGANWVTITDQTGGDSNGGAGTVTWVGSLGVFSVNVSTGSTIGSTTLRPNMDLNSINISTGGPGSLIIEFSEKDFDGPRAGLSMLIGGTILAGAGSSVNYTARSSATNVEFGAGATIGTLGPFGNGAFSGTGSTSAIAADPYSLTQRVELVFAGSGSASFNANLVPEPASIALFGLGLVAVGAARRRRKANAV